MLVNTMKDDLGITKEEIQRNVDFALMSDKEKEEALCKKVGEFIDNIDKLADILKGEN